MHVANGSPNTTQWGCDIHSVSSQPQMPEASMQGSLHSGGAKAVLPPHALALYQQQITMAHGESSQEIKQQQQQLQLAGQPGKVLSYNPQMERDSSPRVRPRSPSNDKDGSDTSVPSLDIHVVF